MEMREHGTSVGTQFLGRQLPFLGPLSGVESTSPAT